MKYNFFDIGNRIVNERNKLNWSQDDLIEKLSEKSVQIGRNTISNIENGCKDSSNFSVKLLAALSDLFNCEIGYLLCEYDCKTGRNTDIKKEIKISDESINILKGMNREEITIVDALIERGDIDLLIYAIENYYRQTYTTIDIRGFSMKTELGENESNKIFEYMSNEYLHEIFNDLIHDKEVTNTFMKKVTSDYYDAVEEKIIKKGNDVYEQTEERKIFTKKYQKYINKQRKKNESTDYYNLLSAKQERK